MITILVVCIIIFGINCRIYFDSSSMVANIEVKILRRFNIYKVKFILWGGKIFFSVNGKKYKQLEQRKKKRKKRFNFKHRLHIERVTYTLVVGDKNSSINTLFMANLIAFFTDYLPLMLKNKVKIENIEKNILPKFNQSGVRVLINFVISGKGIYTLLYNLIVSKLRKKEVKYAN